MDAPVALENRLLQVECLCTLPLDGPIDPPALHYWIILVGSPQNYSSDRIRVLLKVNTFKAIDPWSRAHRTVIGFSSPLWQKGCSWACSLQWFLRTTHLVSKTKFFSCFPHLFPQGWCCHQGSVSEALAEERRAATYSASLSKWQLTV